MGREWKVDLFRPAQDHTGSTLLEVALELPRVAADTERPLLEVDVRFSDGKRERARSIARGARAFLAGRSLGDFLASFGSGNARYPSVTLWGSWFRAGQARYEMLTLSNRVFGFDTLRDEVQYLDLCVGNLVGQFQPALASFRIDGAMPPSEEELLRGYLAEASPFLGYFGPLAIERKGSAFWQDLVEAILHPDPASVGDPEERPWVRHFADGSLMFRFSGKSAIADERIARTFDEGLGIRFRAE